MFGKTVYWSGELYVASGSFVSKGSNGYEQWCSEVQFVALAQSYQRGRCGSVFSGLVFDGQTGAALSYQFEW